MDSIYLNNNYLNLIEDQEKKDVEIQEKEMWRITLVSLVEPFYESFSTDGYKKILDLLTAMSNHLEVPMKNIKIYQDSDKTKCIIYDDELTQLINETMDTTIYFVVTANFGSFIKQAKIAIGSFATIYKCTEYGSKDVWCIKKFKANKNKIENVLLINREIEIFSRLESHPRIVKLERNFQTNKSSFIALEYMTEGSLRNYLNKNGPISESQLVVFSKQILEAIDFLHGKNIIHRDLKSPKFLLDKNLNVKLCGFVSAKIIKGMPEEDFRNASTESIVGTANWMAPEVINGEKYGSSADIWSFGAVMVEMITGKPPYYNLASFQVIYKLGVSKRLEFSYPESSSEKLKSFVSLCLQLDPLKRPTAKELLVHKFLNDLPGSG